jgi:transposase
VITIRPDLKVLVATQPVDFRKGMDALAGHVAERLSENPYAGPSSSSDPSEPIA